MSNPNSRFQPMQDAIDAVAMAQPTLDDVSVQLAGALSYCTGALLATSGGDVAHVRLTFERALAGAQAAHATQRAKA